MERSKLKVSISKSSPCIIAFPADKRKTVPKLRKPLVFGKRPFKEFKRNIIANTDKDSRQRRPYFILEKGINYTPEALYDSDFPSASDKLFAGLPAAKPLGRTRSMMHDSPSTTSSMHSLSSRFSLSRSRFSLVPSLYSSGMSSTLSAVDFSWTSMIRLNESDEELEIGSYDRPPSMFRLREDPPPRKRVIETKFTVHLQESENIFLLKLETGADAVESEHGKIIAECNAAYEKMLHTSKTISHTATQTTRVFQKHRKLYIPRNQRANSSAYATVWDIYDTYEIQHKQSLQSALSGEEGQGVQISVAHVEDEHVEEFEYLGKKFDNRLLNAFMVMERLIEKERFGSEQLLFQGLLVQDPLSTDVNYNYTLKHLWTFHSECTKGRNVTTMCWSTSNHNILAVGYGKFKYTDRCDGLVCIWNVKNPRSPERQFSFEDPVTFVTFSDFREQILAVSFYSGLVLLLDIISRSLMVKASNYHYPIYHPVWQIQWLASEDKASMLQLLTCGKNGIVYRYKKTKFFMSKRLMTMGRPHGKIQGVEQPKKCYPRKTLACRNPSAEVLVLHPTDAQMYLIGTSEGCVYFCSVNHRHDHLEVFVAHNGPVYAIRFNPFCSKVFLTCGADCCIRIWAESVFEPLITLESGMAPVQDAVWDPLLSTAIVSITGTFIEIWDICRRTSTPKSRTQSRSKSLNTVIKFSENKFNLCIGDTDGNVHVMALTEMPFSPRFQEEILVQSIQNALICHPEILEKLYRLGHPFACEESTLKAKLYRRLDHLQKRL